MSIVLLVLISSIGGYIIGSVPWALIIGKTFYKTDIRQHGSKNLGGTNAGRVLGRKAGIFVMLGDLSKGIFAFYFINLLIKNIDISSAERTLVLLSTVFAAAIGHSFPVFANFRGGKIVSIFAGFVICTNYYLLITGVAIFFLILALTKFVSLSSLTTAFSVCLLSFTNFAVDGMVNGIEKGYVYSGFLLAFFLFMSFKHRSNIKSLIAGKERKIKWIE